MQKIYDFCLSSILILMIFLIVMCGLRRRDENLAERIAPEILRFHVLANSNSPEDQALKLEVKDLLLETIRSNLTEQFSGSCSGSPTRDQVIRSVNENKAMLEQCARTYLEEQGYDYPVDIRLETCEFPQKTYGDMTFPAGTYEAVRVFIGEGKGENFWCVLYPALCYLDSTYAVVPDSSKEVLQSVLAEDDFAALMIARHSGHTCKNHSKTEQENSLPRLKFRFKFLEYVGQSRESQE